MASEMEIVETLPPMHPGEVLREEFLDPLGLSAGRVAKACGVPRTRDRAHRRRRDRDHRRHGGSARPLLRHDRGILDEPTDPL